MTESNDEWGPLIAYNGGGRPEGLADNALVQYLKDEQYRWWFCDAAGDIDWGGTVGPKVLIYRVLKETEKVVAYSKFGAKRFSASPWQYPSDTHKMSWNKKDEDKDAFTITVKRIEGLSDG